jgi:DNA-binding MarR family transcriptional regulator
MPKHTDADKLPEAVFHAIATSIQRVVYIVEEECGIAPIDLLTLWYVDYFGTLNERGQSVILRRTLTQMLTVKFRMSDGQISKALDSLSDKRLIERTNVSREERKRLFQAEEGPRLVVILTEDGTHKFDQFKERITFRYKRWLSTLNAASRAAIKNIIVPIAIQSANWIIKRYDPVVLASARDMLTGTESNEDSNSTEEQT